MSWKPGDSYVAEFTTCRFDTGAATNADSTPVATANRNGTDDSGFVLTVANLDTGRYKVTGTIPGTYASGDSVHISVAATVNSVSGKGVVDGFVLDGKRLSDVASGSGVVVTTNNDKTGYGLSSAAIQAIWDALTSALTTAGSIGKKLADWALGSDSRVLVSANSHSSGESVAAVLGDVAGKVLGGGSGTITAVGAKAQVDMTQSVPTSNTAQTVGDALNAARADGFGKWTLIGTTLTLYAGDGTTVVRAFTLDSSTNPTTRT